MKKKAQYTGIVIGYIPKIIMISVIFIVTVLIVNRYIMSKVDVQELEASLLIDRMIYSRNCFSYYDDDLLRPFPGIIDLDKFTSENLDSCIFYDYDSEGKTKNIYTSAEVILTYLDSGEEEIIFHNEWWYSNWYPLRGIRGPGGTKSYKESNYVLIKTENGLEKGRLDFDIILPNS